jgi:GH25 family lysozyme M1 (1,4-beta-N-acetylmuramidase)
MKKRLSLIFMLICFSVKLISQPEFNQPWTDTTLAIIIDPYYGNSINFEKLVTDKRVAAVIHKATQGLKTDKKLNERKELVKKNNLLWGTYHLGTPADPIEQADFYLKAIAYDSTQLMALDLESTDSSKFMSLFNARKFIEHIYSKTQKYPLIYCNKAVLTEINNKYANDSLFSHCGLWYARFRKNIPDFDTTVWNTYTLWQFSCEINCQKTGECLYNVPGTLYDMDINLYFGTVDELKKKWPDINKVSK